MIVAFSLYKLLSLLDNFQIFLKALLLIQAGRTTVAESCYYINLLVIKLIG